MEEKTVVILGATGSIGTQTVDVISKIGGFRIVGISFGKNVDVANRIVGCFRVPYYCGDGRLEHGLRMSSIEELLDVTKPDVVVCAIPGIEGVKAAFESLNHTKRLALATKETLVCAGPFFKKMVQERGVELIPVDSEHSAILQLMEESVARIILTASGGAVRDVPKDRIRNLGPREVLKHPTWRMGQRITVDSATMVNKLFEVIEAHELFDLPYENIQVAINPSSFVHGVVYLRDGTVKIHAGIPDMRVPIAYALTYPERKYNGVLPDLRDFDLRLLEVEEDRYPVFHYGLKSIVNDLSKRIALNAVDEVVIEAFLNERISFGELVDTIVRVVDNVSFKVENLEDVFQLDLLVRDMARVELERIGGRETK
ncbi:1-deoxy-D-xylulose-5-phosphate reductoisomerase [Fervidobacterium thailandense]|uniref:1-deoxy-D-xylulose 5-phosphate reductoisomerase n=1 Tax=Fervidobacterium thailandense TaxID=1008305 RepID=A0A1E3G4D2_9BACT|nr:1-deoxy-D-xylulose-5-phosphate reductoisomerase [Fervidobacterium thailandense]ODN31136.1 1-deoxy-D-xylulose 5-phosphate reductoisomerase [Fervidobacterium thailandense]